MLADEDGPVARYGSGQENSYFGWTDARAATARRLADLFLERFPRIATESEGRDWAYAGWYLEMLGLAKQGYFPSAYADYPSQPRPGFLDLVGDNAPGSPLLPMPPAGEYSP